VHAVAAGRVGVGDRRRAGGGPRLVIARECPHVAGLGLAAGVEYGPARLVVEQFFGNALSSPTAIVQRLQLGRRGADPTRQ
jgi:hypothetical protein